MEDLVNKEEVDCAICGLLLKDKYTHKLVCSHEFHYECLLKTFQLNNSSYHKKNHCPYCRHKCDYLPPVNGLKKQKD